MIPLLGATYDADHGLHDGALAASAAGTVDGLTRVLDLGLSVFYGVLVIDVSAIEVASNDELYRVIIQGSSVLAFTAGTIENLAELTLGATADRPGAAITPTPGRYLLPFINVQKALNYRFVRGYTVVSGSIASGIDYRSFISPGPRA